MIVKAYQIKKIYMGNFTYGADLLDSIQCFIEERSLKVGSINLIGAAQVANFGYYNPTTSVYEKISIDHQVEIVSCMGNISMRNGKPMAHVHITLSDDQGHCFAGHLLPGTIVFVGEFVITEFDGPPLERHVHPTLGVPLWF